MAAWREWARLTASSSPPWAYHRLAAHPRLLVTRPLLECCPLAVSLRNHPVTDLRTGSLGQLFCLLQLPRSPKTGCGFARPASSPPGARAGSSCVSQSQRPGRPRLGQRQVEEGRSPPLSLAPWSPRLPSGRALPLQLSRGCTASLPAGPTGLFAPRWTTALRPLPRLLPGPLLRLRRSPPRRPAPDPSPLFHPRAGGLSLTFRLPLSRLSRVKPGPAAGSLAAEGSLLPVPSPLGSCNHRPQRPWQLLPHGRGLMTSAYSGRSLLGRCPRGAQPRPIRRGA